MPLTKTPSTQMSFVLGLTPTKCCTMRLWQGVMIHACWDMNHWAHREFTTILKVKKMAMCTSVYTVVVKMHLGTNGSKTTDPILTQPMTPGMRPKMWQRKCAQYVSDLITWRARPGIHNCWTKLPVWKLISTGAQKTVSKTLCNWKLWS